MIKVKFSIGTLLLGIGGLFLSACNSATDLPEISPQPTATPIVTPTSIPEVVAPTIRPSHAIGTSKKQLDYKYLLNETPPPKAQKVSTYRTPSPEEKKMDQLGVRVVGIPGRGYSDISRSDSVSGKSSGNIYEDVKAEKVVHPEAKILTQDSVLSMDSSTSPKLETTSVPSVNEIKGLYPNSFPIGIFDVTAYDLGFASVENLPGDPYYGHTSTGQNLIGKTREEAMAVAVDPSVIPFGTKIYLKFTGDYESFSGLYIASERGGAIKGRKIDLFIGDFGSPESSQEALDFGHQYPQVYLVK